MSVEILGPERVILPDDRDAAERIGLPADAHNEIVHTEIHYIGNIELPGEEPHPVARIQCGPVGSMFQGGTKFKAYGLPETWKQDTIDHGVAMLGKDGIIGETQFGGGKTVANIDPSPKGLDAEAALARRISAIDQLAGLMINAGLADPYRSGTAGDEGTNGEIGTVYVEGLRRRGVPHPEACVTGKPDMRVRPGATGRGAMNVMREMMRLHDETEAGLAIQGAGFAGAYAAAEAFDPLDEADRDTTIAPMAIGDLKFSKLPDGTIARTPVTLATDDKRGLPITHKMINEILLHGIEDPDMQAVGFDKLLALARKIERTSDVHVVVKNVDVLTYNGSAHDNMYLAPAATSNVIHPENISDISINKWLEIGNHTVRAEVLAVLGSLGVTYIPGELVNAGGVMVSMMEKRRDLARIKAAEGSSPYIEVPDSHYQDLLRTGMRRAARQVVNMSREHRVELPKAAKMLSLANYALAQRMHIDPSVRDLITA